MEAAEVDEGVGAEEEVGDDGGDGIELGCGEEEESELSVVGTRRASGRQAPTDEDEADGDDIGEHVAADGLAVPPVALPKKAYERVELVPAETLWAERERCIGDCGLCRGRGMAAPWWLLHL